VRGLLEKDNPSAYLSAKKRFHFYDSVLLHILHHGKMPGDKIFTRLFKNNKASDVLAFLDNESSLAEELNIIGSLPTGIFLKAALTQIARSV
jgi:lycopene beta-cyclase